MRGHYTLLMALVALLLGGCLPERESTTQPLPVFLSYKDIPGVTAEEISAIEALKKTRTQFTYGVSITTEAFITENGTVGGFAQLLNERLSGLFGIPFVAKAYAWEELNEKLKAQTLDFTSELSPTPERQQHFFMTDPIFNRPIKIFSNKNTPPLDTIAIERPLRVGFLAGSATYALVKDSWPLPFEAHFLASETEISLLLKNQTLDAYIDESSIEAIFEDTNFIKVSDYYPLCYSPLSMATANPQLKPIIDVVQKYLQHGGLTEVAKLHRAGMIQYDRHRLFKLFTEEEKTFIGKHRDIGTALPLGVEYDNYPIAFYNQQEKKFQGIALDVLAQVTLLTGLEFKAASTPQTSWPELLAWLEQGKIALVSELALPNSKEKESRFIWTEGPYSTDHYALLSRTRYPDISMNQIMHARVGLIQHTSATALYKGWFPNSVNDTVFTDYPAAFAALEQGRIDLIMATQNALLSLTNYLEKPGFKANIVFQQPAASVFGLNNRETVLRSILDKTLHFVDTADISDRWKRKVFDYNSKMLREMLPYMLVAFALLMLGLVTVAILLMKNRRMSKNLEATVVQRTSELEKASRAKSDFLSSMSHEMRTPMNAIIGMAKIAEATSDTSRLRYCLSTIGTSARHLLLLINDILDMSKIEAGKLELHDGPLNIATMLTSACSMVMDKAKEKKQTLSVTTDTAMPLDYLGDELRLSQVITNMLSNAVKFTPEGGAIQLTVRESGHTEDFSVLCFSVVDNGIGMTEGQIARLFKVFSQADGSIAQRFGGTGLGLAISKNIVEKMDGRVWVNSVPGKGSTFSFEITLKRLPSPEAVSTPVALNTETDAQGPLVPDFSGITLLLVEDADINREIFISLLENTGMTIDVAVNGLEAVEKFRSHPERYDIIIMDLQMPVMDGYEATKTIRSLALPNAQTIPIVAMTANAFREDIKKCLESGMNDHTGKPIDVEALTAKIQTHTKAYAKAHRISDQASG